MEPRVEARDLRHLGHARGERAYRPQVVRLMQRCERHQPLQFRDDLGGDAHRARVVDTAVNDAMSHRAQLPDTGARMQPIEQKCEGAVMTGGLALGPRVLVDARAGRIHGTKSRPPRELFEIAGDNRCQCAAVDMEHRKLEAR